MGLQSVLRAFHDTRQKVSVPQPKHKAHRATKFVALTLAGLSAASLFAGKASAQNTQNSSGETHVVCGIAPGQSDVVEITYRGNKNPTMRMTYTFNPAAGTVVDDYYTSDAKWGHEVGTIKGGIQSINIFQGSVYAPASAYRLAIVKSGIRSASDQALFDDANQRLAIAAVAAANSCSALGKKYNEDIIPIIVQDPQRGIRIERVIVQLTDPSGSWRFDIRSGDVRGVSDKGLRVDGSGEIFRTSILAKDGNFNQFTLRQPGQADTYFPINGALAERTPGRSEVSQTQPIPPELQSAIQATQRAIKAARPAFTFPAPNWFPSYTVPPAPNN